VQPFLFVRGSRIAELHGGIRDARYVILYLLLLVHAVVWLYHVIRNRRVQAPRAMRALSVDQRYLLLFIVIAYVVWEAQFSILRYATTVESLAPLLIVILILPLISSRSLRLTAVIVVAVVIVYVARPLPEHPVFKYRLEWTDTFWGVELPEIKDPDNTIILMANPRPWSYLIPLFPPGVRFVGLLNNFTSPNDGSWHQAEMRRLVQEHRGDAYLLSREQDSVLFGVDRNTLLEYDVGVALDLGMPIESRHSRPGIELWPALSRWRWELKQQQSDQ
jgi:hypothetical protein